MLSTARLLDLLSQYWWALPVGILLIIILVKLLPRYRIAPPDTAFIISGLLRRNYKVRNPDGTVSQEVLLDEPTGIIRDPAPSSALTGWTCA